MPLILINTMEVQNMESEIDMGNQFSMPNFDLDFDLDMDMALDTDFGINNLCEI